MEKIIKEYVREIIKDNKIKKIIVKEHCRNVYTVNWENIIEGFNCRFKTSYCDIRELIEAEKKTRTKKFLIDTLGVSQFTLNDIIDYYNIDYYEFAPKKLKTLLAELGQDTLGNMTCNEITIKFGFGKEHTRAILNQYGYKYKRVRFKRSEKKKNVDCIDKVATPIFESNFELEEKNYDEYWSV